MLRRRVGTTRLLLALAVLAASALITTAIVFARNARHNGWYRDRLQSITPYRWWVTSDFLYEPWSDMPMTPPKPVEWLSKAPWAGQWPMPSIASSGSSQRSTKEGALLLKLHIFSMNSARSRARRDIIREQDWLAAIPQAYRDLVELKFVLGRCLFDCTEIDEEQREFGDLHMLDMDENMNMGKSTSWIRSINEAGQREALWAFKVDDDNLLDILVRLDPTVPTYLGDPSANWEHRFMYMQGGLYGVSYGIIRTLGATDIPYDELVVDYPEDARIGYLVSVLPGPVERHEQPDPTPFPIPAEKQHPFSLPFLRRYPPPPCFRRQVDYPGGPLVSMPNAESGLVRIDLKGFFGQVWDDYLWRDHRQVGVHGIKADEDCRKRWVEMQADLAKHGKGQWKVPEVLQNYLSM